MTKTLWIALAAMVACAQAPPPRFEVISIKRTTIDPPVERRGVPQITPGGMTIRAASLKKLIAIAWDTNARGTQVAESQMTGSELYDVAAKASGLATQQQMNAMLQTALAGRFGLSVHIERRQYSALALVIGKNRKKSSTMTAVEPGPNPQVQFLPLPGNRIRLTGRKAPVSMLIAWLQSLPDDGRPVLDETGLIGAYDFVLEFSRTQPAGSSAPSTGPSMFSAVQDQLGLRLDSRKAMINTLVIDRVNRKLIDN